MRITAQVSFIYPFLLQHCDIEGKFLQDFSTGEVEMNPIVSSKDNLRICESTPENRDFYSVPVLSLKTRFLQVKGEEKNRKISSSLQGFFEHDKLFKDQASRDRNLEIQKHDQSIFKVVLKIFENGAGVVRFDREVSIENGSKAPDFNQGLAMWKDSLDYLRDFSSFGERYGTLYKAFKNIMKKVSGSQWQAKEASKEKDEPVWVDDPDESEPAVTYENTSQGQYYQTPYPVTFVAMETEDFDCYIKRSENLSGHSDESYRNAYTEFADRVKKLLVRPVEGDLLSDQFCEENGITKIIKKDAQRIKVLSNSSMAESFFIRFLYKAGLVFYEAPEGDPEKYAKYMTFILEMIEFVKMRWFAYNLINKLLDQRIQAIEIKFEQLKEEADDENLFLSLRKMIDKNIRDKAMTMRFLENIMMEKIGSEGMTEIYQALSQELNYPETERRIVQKLQTVDRLYDDMLEFFRLKRTSRISKDYMRGRQ